MSIESSGIPGKSLQEKIETSKNVQEVLKELSTIAQVVGGDFGMNIKVGEPGHGSYYDSVNVSITMDPEHLLRNPNEAKFIVAHEGGHRAITRSPMQLGVPNEIINNLYSKPGFAFIQNAIEDPADNDWFSKKFVGLKEYVKETYDKEFESEDVVLSTPEVDEYVKRLGFMPKFAIFGSEVIRNWHQNRYGTNVDSDVLETLNKTQAFVKQSISEIPASNPSESEVIEKAKTRFKINTEQVWPHVEKLLEEDIKNAKRNEAIEDIKKKTKNIQQTTNQQASIEDNLDEKDSSGLDNSKDKESVSTNTNSLIDDLKVCGFSEQDLDEIENQSSLEQSQVKGGVSKDGSDRHEKILEKLRDKLDKYILNLSEEERGKLEEKAIKKLEEDRKSVV